MTLYCRYCNIKSSWMHTGLPSCNKAVMLPFEVLLPRLALQLVQMSPRKHPPAVSSFPYSHPDEN